MREFIDNTLAHFMNIFAEEKYKDEDKLELFNNFIATLSGEILARITGCYIDPKSHSEFIKSIADQIFDQSLKRIEEMKEEFKKSQIEGRK